MVHTSIILLLLFPLVCFANGRYRSSNCRQYENRIYHLKVTFPDKEPLYAAIRFQDDGAFDELFSIAGGNNEKEVGANFSLSNRFGYYKCLSGDRLQATGLGFLYQTEGVPFLKKNGALVIHDYYFKFSDYGKRCTGVVKFGVFKHEENPFSTEEDPVFEGETGKVKCELLKFRKYYSLSLE